MELWLLFRLFSSDLSLALYFCISPYKKIKRCFWNKNGQPCSGCWLVFEGMVEI
jgi:hypothetical protein